MELSQLEKTRTSNGTATCHMTADRKSTDTVSVVYVVGTGRSGTTLLDTIFSNHPRMYGAGELATLAVGDLFHRVHCPCGRPADQCQFWQAVVEDWFANTGLHDDTLAKPFPRGQGFFCWR